LLWGAVETPPPTAPSLIKNLSNVGRLELIVKRIEIDDKLCSFIKDFSDDLNSLELLLFFSRHPNARFNRNALLHAPMSSGRFDSGIALKRLIDKKWVVAHAENGITLYALTKDEPAHSFSAGLVNIDQRQWQMIVEEIINADTFE
jgi:hypothetical protein